MRYYLLAILGIAALAGILVIGGCGGGSGGSSGIQLFLSDAPIDAKAVDITISRIDVSKDGVGWTNIRTFTPEITVNLLDYRYDGDSSTLDKYLLADAPLEQGHYTQIRLLLTKIELEDHAGNRYDVEMNSQDQTGLKVVGAFTVSPGTKSAVLLDFDACRSIVAQGNGAYRLNPTVRVVPLQITGSINGVVAFKDADGNDDAVPDGVSIVASQAGQFVAASPIIADGSFYISALLAGDYDLSLEFAQETPVTHAIPNLTTASVTVGNETDVGTIIASPIP